MTRKIPKDAWVVRQSLLKPRVVSLFRSAAYSLLLLGIAVQAGLEASRSSISYVRYIIAGFAFLTLIACVLDFITKNRGVRPELHDLHALRVAQGELDSLRDDAKKIKAEPALQARLDAFVKNVLREACRAVCNKANVQAVLMMPRKRREKVLRIVHVYPRTAVVDPDFQLPLKLRVERLSPEDGVGAAGFAFRGLCCVYVPNTQKLRGYWIRMLADGRIKYDPIGLIWVKEEKERCRSLVAVPIYVDARDEVYPFGVLNLESNYGNAFRTADFYLAHLFANVLAQGFSVTQPYSEKLTRRS